MLWSFRHRLTGSIKSALQWRAKITSYYIKAAPMELAGVLAANIDRLLLAGMVPSRELGVYVVVFSVARIMSVLNAVVGYVVYPAMTSVVEGRTKYIHDNVFRMIAYIAIAAAIGSHFIGGWLVEFVYGPSYAGTSLLLEVLVIDTGVRVLANIVVQLYLASGKPTFASVVQGVSVAVESACLVVFVPTLGIVGAAFALLTSSVVSLCCLLVGAVFILGYDVPRMYPKSNDLTFLLNAFATRK
jgi:O-antigen/teichoic acid export membrane protein